MGEVKRFTNGTTGGPVFVDVKDGKILRITPMSSTTPTLRPGPSRPGAATSRRPARPRRRPGRWRIAPPSTRPSGSSPRSSGWTSIPRATATSRTGASPATSPSAGTRRSTSWPRRSSGSTGRSARPACCPLPARTTCGATSATGTARYFRFLNLIGYTYAEHNPDSWEGWHWGAMHMWGFSHRLGIPEQYGLLEDALKHTELIIFWSADPESSCNGVYGGHEGNIRRRWLKELGRQDDRHRPLSQPHPGSPRRQVVLAPAGHRRGHGSGHRLHLAHRGHLRQGVHRRPRPPASTSGRTTSSARPTACPRPPSGPRPRATSRPARSGRWPGSGLPRRPCWRPAGRAAWAAPAGRRPATSGPAPWWRWPPCRAWASRAATSGAPPAARRSTAASCSPATPRAASPATRPTRPPASASSTACSPTGERITNPQHSTEGQTVPRLNIPEAMRHETVEWRGKGFCGSHIESQFQKYEYPAQGYPQVEMYYRYGGSFFGTMTETNRYVTAYREGKMPFVVNQAIWFEGETKFADIILPACTNFERWDISECGQLLGLHRRLVPVHEPPGHRLPAEVHRAAGRVEVRLRDLRRAGQAPGRLRAVQHGRQDRARLGEGLLPRHRHAQGHELGGLRQEGLLRGPRSRGEASQSRPCAGSPKAGPRTRPTGARRPGTRSRARACRPERQDRVRVLQPQAPRSHRHHRPRAPGHGPAVHRELGGPPHRRALRQVPAADGLAPSRSSASTPWATPRTAG